MTEPARIRTIAPTMMANPASSGTPNMLPAESETTRMNGYPIAAIKEIAASPHGLGARHGPGRRHNRRRRAPSRWSPKRCRIRLARGWRPTQKTAVDRKTQSQSGIRRPPRPARESRRGASLCAISSGRLRGGGVHRRRPSGLIRAPFERLHLVQSSWIFSGPFDPPSENGMTWSK